MEEIYINNGKCHAILWLIARLDINNLWILGELGILWINYKRENTSLKIDWNYG